MNFRNIIPVAFASFAGYGALHVQHLNEVRLESHQNAVGALNRLTVLQAIRRGYEQGEMIDIDAVQMSMRKDLLSPLVNDEAWPQGAFDPFEVQLIEIANEDIAKGRFTRNVDADRLFEADYPPGLSEDQQFSYFKSSASNRTSGDEAMTALFMHLIGRQHSDSFFAHRDISRLLLERTRSQWVLDHAKINIKRMSPIPVWPLEVTCPHHSAH